jgi:hypothetical protein
MPVPYPTDESEANALPDPELNPLLNPVLAAHMGRWAEVYFTNPPEKRGQAVSDLLRELESVSPPEPASVQLMDEGERKRKGEMAGAPDSSPAKAEYLRICGACAYDNSAGQRFCGMCGAPLQITLEEHLSQVAEAVPINGASWSEHEPSPGGNSIEYAIEPSVSSAAGGSHEARERFWPLRAKDLSDLGVESEPVRYRYQLYVGVILAILVVVLVYMAWRGTEALSSVAVPQSAPSRTIPPPQPAPAASAQQASATRSTLPGGNPTPSVQSQASAGSPKDQAADAAAARIVVAAAGTTAITPGPSGAEEFATAMKYLNGNPGLSRDSREAAQWLWKAVGKGNMAATMTLSDLYLRGDGVPKSCDQARLLLDAAARRGGSAAAERLRNLQAFGCE